jgi:hypothetical protein
MELLSLCGVVMALQMDNLIGFVAFVLIALIISMLLMHITIVFKSLVLMALFISTWGINGHGDGTV